MRGTAPVMIVLAIGVATMFVTGSGFADAWGQPAPETGAAADALNESADNVGPDGQPVEGPVSTGDSEVIGLIASGLGTLFGLAGSVALLPVTLTNLGLPAWFAFPAGALAQIVVGVSLIEWATNREWT